MKYNENKLKEAVKNSYSVSETMRKLGIPYMGGGPHKNISIRIKKLGIDTSHFIHKRRGNYSTVRKTANEILVDKSSTSDRRAKTIYLRRALLESNVKHKCSICEISEWNDKKLVLQIDHIDGNPLNDVKENLRFICPNCHSQEPTTKKRTKRKPKYCKDCNTEVTKYALRCKSCASIISNNLVKKFHVEKGELIELVKEYPMTKIGKIFGVSDNAIRKRCKSLGIDIKNMGSCTI